MELTPNGLSITGEINYEEWERIGFDLFRIQGAWQWWVGDWINYGEKKYGETHKAAIEVTGKTYGSVRNVASIANCFELSRRRDNLSWSHHAEVAGLEVEEQDRLLDRAEQDGWSRNKLREEVSAIKGELIAEEDEPEEEPQTVGILSEVMTRLSQLKPHQLITVRDWITDFLGAAK